MALSGNKVSVKHAINMVYRNTGIREHLNYADLIEWAGEAMDLIGVPMSLAEGIANENIYDDSIDPYITVSDYKAFMPCPWVEIVQIREYTSKQTLTYSTNTFHPNKQQADEKHKTSWAGNLTYKIKGNCIYTNFKEGKLEVVYRFYEVDEDNYPLIPAETQYTQAIAAYLQMKTDYILWRYNKISERIYRDSEQDWLFKVGQAGTFAHIPTIDQMESWKNQMLRLIPNVNEHSTGFIDLAAQEEKYNHDR